MPKQTFVYSKYNPVSQPFNDVANTSEFWIFGNALSNTVAKLSVKSSVSDWVTLWEKSKVPSAGQINHSIFENMNMIRNGETVNFCQTVDLSAIPYKLSQVMIKVIEDVTLIFHLNGQLLTSQNCYVIANRDTVLESDYRFFLYGSDISLKLEETSFQNINNDNCENYNSSWTYDDCLINTALGRLGEEHYLLGQLLKSNSNTIINTGIEATVLKRFSSILQSGQVMNTCRKDCRSLVVKIMAETSSASPKLVPPMVDINIFLPEIYRIDEVCMFSQLLLRFIGTAFLDLPRL
jgi:hypothetical protein